MRCWPAHDGGDDLMWICKTARAELVARRPDGTTVELLDLCAPQTPEAKASDR